jgi:hypothetical protein
VLGQERCGQLDEQHNFGACVSQLMEKRSGPAYDAQSRRRREEDAQGRSTRKIALELETLD